MSEVDFEQVERLFHAALARAPAQRAEFVAREASDPAVRAEVESLLAAEQRSGRFLETSLLFAPPPVATNTDELPRRWVGPYRLIREIGRGGMGTVYEAEQLNPKRRVALKVVHGGLSEGAARRLGHEPKVLGRLSHPSVASIYDASQTDDGLSYFVMEYIDGERLDEYVRQHQLGRRDRLKIFLKICEAIQHAHMKSVIHLDLKPSNILVTTPPGTSADEVQIKVVDFGVAAITGSDTTMTTRIATTSGMLGTLSYMSPEQRRGDNDALDARSDVYSLGVILFKLMTGELPYPVENLSIPDAWRVFAEQPPRRPRALDPSVAPDIETIIRTAIAEEPARRYQSVSELAGDVQRFLADLPITARRPTKLYEWSKFARRNKGLVATLAAVLLGLVTTIVGTWVGLVRERSAKTEVGELNRTLALLLADDDPDAVVRRREILDTWRATAERRLIEGHVEEAEAEYAQLVRAAQRLLPPGYWYVAGLQGEHAECLQQLGRFAEAEAQMLASYESLRADPGETHPRTIEAVKRLIRLYDTWEKPSNVAEWSERLRGGPDTPDVLQRLTPATTPGRAPATGPGAPGAGPL